MPAFLIADALSTGHPTRTTAVSAGQDHVCAIKPGGILECWGENRYSQLDTPDGRFTAVSAGQYHSCGIKTDGTVACWGINWRGQSDAPKGTFTAVSAGSDFSCGIKTDGAITCWGSSAQGRLEAPEGTFTAVSAGRDFLCAIKSDRSITCWGNNEYQSCQSGTGGTECTDVRSNQLDAPEGAFTAISVSAPSSGGHAHSCAIRSDGSVACWGDNRYGQLKAPDRHIHFGRGWQRPLVDQRLFVRDQVRRDHRLLGCKQLCSETGTTGPVHAHIALGVWRTLLCDQH